MQIMVALSLNQCLSNAGLEGGNKGRVLGGWEGGDAFWTWHTLTLLNTEAAVHPHKA